MLLVLAGDVSHDSHCSVNDHWVASLQEVMVLYQVMMVVIHHSLEVEVEVGCILITIIHHYRHLTISFLFFGLTATTELQLSCVRLIFVVVAQLSSLLHITRENHSTH